MEEKIRAIISRLKELEAVLGTADVFSDQKKYKAITQEHSYLSSVKSLWDEIQKCKEQIASNKELLKDEKDQDFIEVLKEDIEKLEISLPLLETKLCELLIPPDPDDNKNCILEIRAGTGGDEAALFVGDCVRMYKLYADKMGWRNEHLSSTPSDVGGFKEYVMVLSGENVYRFLRHEGGTHRVQRVPKTEAQGRIHTSAITVAVLLEPDEDVKVDVDERDLRVDTYRSSGAGGQHVNTTDSAVRLTHIPTGVVVYCQEERSQHKNKEKAMRLLKARILEAEIQKQHDAIASNRAEQVGTGDRSEKVRTYNFPQNRVTDHRINLSKHNLDQIMDGDLHDIVSGLVAHYHQQKL